MGASLAGALIASQVQAQTNLVTNGSFDNILSGSGYGTGSQNIQNTNGTTSGVSGWTNGSGYSFVFAPNASAVSGTTADTTGAAGNGGGSGTPLYLWGPGSGSSVTKGSPTGTSQSGAAPAASGGTDGANPGVANGLTNSPNGGNFIAMDGAAGLNGAISQTVSGLQGGGVYKLTFYWAAAEQEGASFEAATTEQFSVGFGNSTATTATIGNVAEGFSGWQTATMYFEATSASQLLSFLAIGTPNGVPPFGLLDGVSLVLAPEPASWAVMMIGIGGVGLLVRRRRAARSRPAA